MTPSVRGLRQCLSGVHHMPEMFLPLSSWLLSLSCNHSLLSSFLVDIPFASSSLPHPYFTRHLSLSNQNYFMKITATENTSGFQHPSGHGERRRDKHSDVMPVPRCSLGAWWVPHLEYVCPVGLCARYGHCAMGFVSFITTSTQEKLLAVSLDDSCFQASALSINVTSSERPSCPPIWSAPNLSLSHTQPPQTHHPAW